MEQNTHTKSPNDLPSIPVISEMAIFLATLLYFQDIGPNLTKQRFRRKQARHQVFFKSAMGKMTGGSVGTFHVFGRKLGLLS